MTVNRYCSVCHYCGTNITDPRDVTADHVIPKCALLLFPELRDDRRNRVKCCRSCNGKKAQIPLSVFLEVRHSGHKLKAAQRTWQGIIQILTFSPEPETELRAKALSAYRPDPSKVFLPAYIPRSGNPPRPKLGDVFRDWDEDRFITGTGGAAS